MKKQNLLAPISFLVLSTLFISGESFGRDKHFVVKLKGNTLFAKHTVKKANQANSTEQEITVTKDVKVEQPVEQVATNTTETVSTNNQETVNSNVVASAPAENTNTIGVTYFNFEDKQVNIHTSIFQMYPGTYLDSMSIVNHLLCDSIREALAQSSVSDNSDNLKVSLDNCIKDSITLDRLGKLSTSDNQVAYNPSGVLIAHCKDGLSANAMDSVTMDVFSGSNLVASGVSDKNGIILTKDLAAGNYYVVFSRKSYQPFSLMQVKITTAGQSYIDIPLAKQDGFVYESFGKNAWLYISTASIAVLFIMVVLAFYLAKYTSKRSIRPAV